MKPIAAGIDIRGAKLEQFMIFNIQLQKIYKVYLPGFNYVIDGNHFYLNAGYNKTAIPRHSPTADDTNVAPARSLI